MGEIAISIPDRFDTSFSWFDTTDCGGYRALKFRFQPNILEILKETCWDSPVYLWTTQRGENIDRLTFTYEYSRSFTDQFSDSISIYQLRQIIKAESDIADFTPYKIILDTIEKIDNYYLSILAFEISDSLKSRFTKTLAASTLINGHLIQLGYEWFSKEDDLKIDKFIESSKYYLRRTHFNNGR